MGVSQTALDNIARYDIWEIVAQYGKFPPPLFMAVLDIESVGTFSPLIYNYYPLKPDGTKDFTRVEVDYATPNGPLVMAWKQPGDGGFAHDPHAVGLGQILDSLRLKAKPPGYGGVPLLYLNDMIVPEKNLRAVAGNLNIQWGRIQKHASVLRPQLQYALLYLAHNQGGQPLLDALASSDKSNALALFTAAKRTGKPMKVALDVASRVTGWELLRGGP